MFHALRHRNFRLYLVGQLISLTGTWMQQLAMSWLIYRLTQSTFILGLVGFLSQLPSLFFSLFAGVYVDRLNQRRLLLWTQSLSAIQALVLAILTLTGKVTLFEIVILNICLGVVNALDMPARQAFVVRMVADRKDLPNAIALNSSVMNGTRLIGPAIAGIMIGILGEGMCFLLNALSYLSVLVALSMMNVDSSPAPSRTEPVGNSLRDGIEFAFGFSPIGTILILLSILSLTGTPYITLFPALAEKVFKGGAHTLGILTVCTGLGSLAATMILASRKSVLYFGRVIGGGAMILGISLLGLAVTTRLVFALPLIFVSGFTLMLQLASSNIVIQTLVEDDKRGRVMSLFTFSLMGVAPFGGLLVGALAEKCGILPTLLFCGGSYFLVSIWYLSRMNFLDSIVEPIYRKLGILPVNFDTEDSPKRSIF